MSVKKERRRLLKNPQEAKLLHNMFLNASLAFEFHRYHGTNLKESLKNLHKTSFGRVRTTLETMLLMTEAELTNLLSNY